MSELVGSAPSTVILTVGRWRGGGETLPRAALGPEVLRRHDPDQADASAKEAHRTPKGT